MSIKPRIYTVPLIAFLLVIAGAGCKSPYMIDRQQDIKDVVTLSAGYGAGAKVRVAPLQVGAFGNRDTIGLRGGEFFQANRHDDVSDHEVGLLVPLWTPFVLLYFIGAPMGSPSNEPVLSGEDRFFLDGRAAIRGKTIDSTSTFIVVRKDSPERWSQLEIAAGLGFTLRFGVNPGELLDFLLGWMTIDIYGDDATQREGPNQQMLGTAAPPEI